MTREDLIGAKFTTSNSSKIYHIKSNSNAGKLTVAWYKEDGHDITSSTDYSTESVETLVKNNSWIIVESEPKYSIF